MKKYIENFAIMLNKYITNTEIAIYEFRVFCYFIILVDEDGKLLLKSLYFRINQGQNVF